MNFIPQLILMLVLILLNAFFAASEYAVISLRKSRINELVKKGDFLAALLEKTLHNRENVINATQIGTTIVNLLLGLIGEPIIAQIIQSLFFFIPPGPLLVFSHSFSIVISLLLLTLITMTFGELIPKTIALNRPDMTAYIIIGPLFTFVKIINPFVRIVKYINSFILTLFNNEMSNEIRQIYSKDEIKIILDEMRATGQVSRDEMNMLLNVFRLGDKSIKQIMTPRSEVKAMDVNSKMSSFMNNNGQSHSRYPVFKQSLDNIVGYVHVKDIYHEILNNKGSISIGKTKIIRKAISIPETRKADEALGDMQKKHSHLAVIYNEFGSMIGIVTLEDIIESLVGEIQDEFDKPIKGVKRNHDGSYLINGDTSIEQIQKRFLLPLKGQGYMTIGGLVFGLLGHEPRVGDEINIGHLFFEVESIQGKRITKLLLKRDEKKQYEF